MSVFDDLFKFVLKAADAAPAYAPERCIAVKQSSGACHACVDACPQEAITLGSMVEIDTFACTGCGLCVQVCPSQALEPATTYAPGMSIRCSEVSGTAQSVICLGRLQASDIVRLSAGRAEMVLAHGDCSDCPVGAPEILEGVTAAVEDARTLLRTHGREVDVRVEARERLDQDGAPQGLTRRELFTGGFRNVRRSAVGALEPLEALLHVRSDEQGPRDLPRETVRRYRILEAARPEAGERVPWRLPRVDDGCIMCPVCTRVCPTDAFSRDFEPTEGSGPVLRLEPERCLGCDACVEACPVRVIHMDDEVTWGELSGGTIEAFRDPAGHGPQGILAF